MIISYNELGLKLDVNSFQPLVIIVENEKTLVQLISDIKLSIENAIETFSISENEKVFHLPKEADIIIDPWDVDCNSKKIKAKLYQFLLGVAQEQGEEKFLQLRSDMFCYMEDLSEHIPYSISYDTQIDPTAIFKSLDISVDSSNADFLEQVIEYMKLLQSLCRVKVLFLVNIKLFLSDEQMLLLYKEANYINLQIILIEHIQKNRISEEKIVIIDRDNCIIDL